MLTRIAIYSVLGLVLNALGQDVTTAGFWCIVGLFWAAEHMARIDTLADIEAELNELVRKDKEKRNE